jgi:hypothetical protein
MGRAGDRVLGDSVGGCEIARDEVEGSVRGARRGDAERESGERQDRLVIRPIGAQLGLALQHHIDIVHRAQHVVPALGKQAGKRLRRGNFNGRNAGQVERIAAVPLGPDLEDADLARREGDVATDTVGCRQHMGGRERGMAAERHFEGRREPAQVEDAALTVSTAGEGGFGEVVFGRDRLHQAVLQPGIENEHGGRVPGEEPLGEGIDLEHAELAHDGDVSYVARHRQARTTQLREEHAPCPPPPPIRSAR